MRRGFSGRSDAFVKSEQGEQGFWPSYADMMSAVALILFFLMLLSYTQNLITGQNLRNTQKTLSNTEETLSITQQNLLASQSELEQTRLDLAEKQSQLTLTRQEVESAQAELSQLTGDLDAARLTLSQQQSDLAAQAQLLLDQSSQIEALEAYRLSASAELESMRVQLNDLAFLRLGIVEKIQASVAEVMGDPSKVSINENGNLVLGDGVFFDSGKFDIKAEAFTTLDRLIDAFAAILSDPENTQYIESIVINGHTDWDGENWDNRVLSTNRANAVLKYLLEGRNGVLNQYAEYFSAAGYGEERWVPGTDQNTDAGRAANRRIEITIVLKDDQILDLVDNILEKDMPEGMSATVIPADG